MEEICNEIPAEEFAKNFKYSGEFDRRTSSYFLMSVSKTILEELRTKGSVSLISRN